MADATTTLADTLLDDLDDLSDVEEEENNVVDNDDQEAGKSTATTSDSKASKTSSLLSDSPLQAHLKAIHDNSQDNNLIIPSNKYLAIVGNELSVAHTDLMDAYNPKLPELADLVTDPLRYKNAVQQIGNEMDVTKIDLSSILSPNQVITISVASSTTSGRPLTEEELQTVQSACDTMESLYKIQTDLTTFVRNRMTDWAPNTSALVGPAIAAQLVGMAGGLAELSRIPSCNLQVLGQTKSNDRGGLSTIANKPHTGLVNQCELVQACPSSLQRKALKVVAAKLALSIRCDFVNVNTGRARTSASGEGFRAEIEKRFHQWEAPDKARTLKALPK